MESFIPRLVPSFVATNEAYLPRHVLGKLIHNPNTIFCVSPTPKGCCSLFLSLSVSFLRRTDWARPRMDAILTNSALAPRTILHPVCTVTSTSSAPIASLVPRYSKNLFLASRTQRRTPWVRNTTYTAPKVSITCGAITEINESQFSDVVLKSDRPVLVEFVANWCGPCRLISPAIEWVAQVWFLFLVSPSNSRWVNI